MIHTSRARVPSNLAPGTAVPKERTSREDDPIRRVNALADAAARAFGSNEFRTAWMTARRALEAMPALSRRSELGPTRIRLLRLISMSLMNLGAYAEALVVQRQVIALGRGRLGRLDRAGVLNELGMLHKYLGNFRQAQRCYRQALALRDRSVAARWLRATLYHNLGGLDHARGRLIRAEAFTRKGLALVQRLVGRDHPRTGQDLGALAAILHGQDRFAEAERLYRRTLAIFERTLGPDHYEVGFVLGNLAVACHERGKLAEATGLYRRCLHIMDRTVGASSPQTALFRAHLGGLCAEQGDLRSARALLARAWRVLDAALGADHPHTVACKERLVELGARRPGSSA
ncbi:Tetratricopeptide repeat-containing protein [Nannocystis exedens]|uniref:Tetratricopeptide repeat-containing protein n=1 Tax=Nannocystis exedens TaxID=54 RepID=A0A1I2GQL4_9BACT|nr:tetratricopeptide repeat protein [Nannocystis exedens]PCC68741.1 photosystem I assembly protein Ycf3 [Nannocystis exedens]SFF19523.1 Tetratricopeptide repeat-containing protein [Nannocystis exedens]